MGIELLGQLKMYSSIQTKHWTFYLFSYNSLCSNIFKQNGLFFKWIAEKIYFAINWKVWDIKPNILFAFIPIEVPIFSQEKHIVLEWRRCRSSSRLMTCIITSVFCRHLQFFLSLSWFPSFTVDETVFRAQSIRFPLIMACICAAATCLNFYLFLWPKCSFSAF